jgi:cytochrome c peroxidase
MTRASEDREGSTVALTRLDDRTFALVADEDDAVLHTVDLSTGRELVTTPLAGSPSQILVAKDGRVLVALRDKNTIQVLEPGASPDQALDSLCQIDTPDEPVALAASPDDSTIVATSGWGHALSAFDAGEMKKRYEVPLARDPRAVVISDDGAQAYVIHVVGSRMSAVDLRAPEHPVRTVDMTGIDPGINRQRLRPASIAQTLKGGSKGQERMGCQSFALAKSMDPPGRVFAPQVLVDPGDGEVATGGYGDGFRATEVASIGVIDEGTGEPIATSLRLRTNDGQLNQGNSSRECLLPRAAVADASRRSFFVTCFGIDAVVEYDAASADPRTAEKHRWQVASGPTGVAVDRAGQRLVVWSQFDQSVAVISLASGPGAGKPTMLALSRKARSASDGDIALGRKLFHSSGDNRISNDGRACASCHPDGRDDALTWATPDGPRNTPMLAGRVGHTAPFGWNGSSDSVQGHLAQTFQRLQGRGLEAHEVAAIETYISTMRAPSGHAPQAGPDAARIAHGKQIFESAESACATCHRTDGTYVDGASHDIGTRAKADRDGTFDTPSLRFVSGTAPYFHDGRYRTLREAITGADGKMGHTSQLSSADVDALEAYLKTL